MTYIYKGRNAKGDLVNGSIESKSRRDAIVELKKDKIILISLKEEKKRKSKKKRDSKIAPTKFKGINLSVNVNVGEKKSRAEEKIINDELSDLNVQEMQDPDYFKKIENDIARASEKTKKDKSVLNSEVDMEKIKKLLSSDIKSNKKDKKSTGRRKVKKKEILMFSKQFVVLLEAGIPLVKCLQILMQQTKNKYFQKVLAYITREVSKGTTLSGAMAKFPNVFDSYYTSMVQTGESTGKLSETFNMLYETLLSNQKLKGKIVESSVYPGFIMTILAVAMIVIAFVIIPSFEELFGDTPLPDFTRIYFAFVKGLGKSLPFLIVGIIIAIIAIKIASRNAYFKYMVDMTKFKLPLFGEVIKEYQNTIMLKTLNLSLVSGISLTESLAIAIGNTTNYGMKFELQNVLNAVIQGLPLSSAMQASPVFPNYTVNMIKVGEESGKMQDMVQNTYQWYDWKIMSFIEKMSKAMEPASIVFVAILVVPMVFAIALPMFDMSSGGLL